MNFRIELSNNFRRQFKKLQKKYPSINMDIAKLGKELRASPQKGTPLGKNCFKIRLSITSKGKGKSGGARVITYVQIIDETIYLLSIYDKSEKDNLNEGEIELLLGEILD
jgi:mRNA-degrading endonuclease RelE of RelBE toxin-antitoxin system